MDTEAILTKHRNNPEDDDSLLLKDGRIVVGQEVDENNHLFYVIRDLDNNYVIEDAEGQQVEGSLKPIGQTVIQTDTTNSSPKK